MNSKNKLFYFLCIFLLFLPIVYSVSLEDLIGSYDFDYSSTDISVDSVSHSGEDTGSNGLYDNLVIDIDVTNTAGTFIFIGDLYKNDILVTTIAEEYTLTAGSNTAQLKFPAKLLQSGNYDLSLTIQEDYLTIYRKEDEYSINFNNQDYEKPEINITILTHSLVNTDADPKSEILQINASINTTLRGLFEINTLIGNGKSINAKANYTLTQHKNIISINFSSKEIRKERITNPKLYQIAIKNGLYYQFFFNYPITYNLNDLDPEQSILTDSYDDQGLDQNDNDLYDILEIEVNLYIDEAATYTIELELKDQHNNYVTRVEEEFNIASVGAQTISLEIDGTDIYRSKINGPYIIDYIKLIKDDIILDAVSEAYTTEQYNYDEFEKPPMPDLTITKIDISHTQTNVTVENIGTASAFGISVDLFGNNSIELKKAIIDILAPEESKTVVLKVNGSNHSILYAIVDYNNIIDELDESNNLFIFGEELTTDDYTFLIRVYPGWNLVSLPLNSTNKTINKTFYNATDVYSFDNTIADEEKKWLYYLDYTQYNFETFTTTMGLWINIEKDMNITTIGKNYSYPIDFHLDQGWNLISYPSLNITLVNETLKYVESDYESILSYIDNEWKGHSPNKPKQLNSLKNLTPGYSYWIKAIQDVDWTFDGHFRNS